MKTGSNGRKWLIHGLALLFLILDLFCPVVKEKVARHENR